MRVTYFGSDLTDPAAVRRIRILRIGGADVSIIGFRRSDKPVTEIDGVPTIDLGQTFDGRLASRCLQIVDCAVTSRIKKAVVGADVLIGRNLEMTLLAHIARKRAGFDVPLVYECLDIHRASLGDGPSGRLLRALECYVIGRTSTLMVSSPGHITHFFGKLGVTLPTVVLAENKRVLNEPQPRLGGIISDKDYAAQPPWRIGWFGKLRCVESFHILFDVAQRHPELVTVSMRGQPIPEVQKLVDRYLPLPNMVFGGSYVQDELDSMYGCCDFTWTIEYYNRGSNSDWCLANRIYEGGYYNCPVIALIGTETATWLKARKTGVLLREPRIDLEQFLLGLTSEQYKLLHRTCEDVPTDHLIWTEDQCREFVGRLMSYSTIT